jgi:hypothetical protein
VTGRDDARARPSHPTVDELSDLREGLLPDADEARVQAHVDQCADCAAEAAALDDVAAVLREAAAEPVAMPATVARAIDDAIGEASAARAGAAAPRRRLEASPAPRSRRRWVKPAFGWLAGAAAAAIVIGGIGGLGNLGSSSDDSAGGGVSDTDTNAEAGVPSPASGSGGSSSGKDRLQPKRIDERSIRTFARALTLDSAHPAAGGTSNPPLPTTPTDSEYSVICPATQGLGGLKRPVVWNGRDALLVVRREARVASVYSCDATPRLLYSAPY